jgi:hypothetical protein
MKSSALAPLAFGVGGVDDVLDTAPPTSEIQKHFKRS